MTSRSNVSKSVARAFRVLELFRDLRRPMTAAQIQHALGLPQPSARVLLRELVDVGYLAYTMPARTYFPTARLYALGDWLGSSTEVHQPLIHLVNKLGALIGETATLSTATYGFVQILYVCRADHPLTLQVAPGMGGPLWRSAVGRTLLSLRGDEEVAEFFAGLEPRDAPRTRRQRELIVGQLREIRSQGYFAGYDVLLKGVGALCLPVPSSMARVPLVLSVAGARERIRPRERAILRTMRTELRELQATVPRS